MLLLLSLHLELLFLCFSGSGLSCAFEDELAVLLLFLFFQLLLTVELLFALLGFGCFFLLPLLLVSLPLFVEHLLGLGFEIFEILVSLLQDIDMATHAVLHNLLFLLKIGLF